MYFDSPRALPKPLYEVHRENFRFIRTFRSIDFVCTGNTSELSNRHQTLIPHHVSVHNDLCLYLSRIREEEAGEQETE